jgi:hypothetical protein
MNSTDFLKLASLVKPELIEKTAKALAALELVSPEHANELKAEMDAIIARPLQLMEKNAGAASAIASAYGKVPQGVKTVAVLGVGSALAGLGSSIATDLYDAARRKFTSGRNFKRIMDANPELSKGFDKKQLKATFDTLHRYAPDFTADALMGGSLLSAMAQVPGNEKNFIVELINSRKNLADAKSKQYSPAHFPLKDVKDLYQGKKTGPSPHYSEG